MGGISSSRIEFISITTRTEHETRIRRNLATLRGSRDRLGRIMEEPLVPVFTPSLVAILLNEMWQLAREELAAGHVDPDHR